MFLKKQVFREKGFESFSDLLHFTLVIWQNKDETPAVLLHPGKKEPPGRGGSSLIKY